jgi:hypothetical protein
MVCSETDFKYPLAYSRGSVFLPDHVTVAKYQKLCGIGLQPALPDPIFEAEVAEKGHSKA